ncbi:type II toxin-antitoxin system Phd/YefM family antitoxin [Phaeobacter marinintestinus]|uniref:type II toxin-antitoxin system Phd/YefM family antitoxin n=1 Tax=Falsiphaeobacter marinintestinus TaxID=1492905 RepID=UPI0011B5EF89|nr:type II toxin-antitoxin system Phd/YefM family antitoxin [Phaeobacter marinintestinus]
MPDPDPDLELSVAALRTQLADALDTVLFDGARIRITRRGRLVAVLTPPSDLARLREGDAVRDLDARLDHARLLEKWEQIRREADHDRRVEEEQRDSIVIRME